MGAETRIGKVLGQDRFLSRVAGVRAISGTGRGLLLVGAAVLLTSLLLPSLTWFTLSSARSELPTGTYTSFQTTELVRSLAGEPVPLLGYVAWIGYAWLFVCAAAAIAASGIGERIRRFGASGILVLLLFAGLLFLTAYQLNEPLAGDNAAVTLGYGFVAAVAGAALVEAGGRLPSAMPTKRGVPAAAMGKGRA